jgi:hypothetical protein
MNEANGDGHDGSSRSHCALILTLMQLDKRSGEYVKTTFTLVDLAGAERPDKVGAGRQSTNGGAVMLVMAACNGGDYLNKNKASALCTQAHMINYELFEIGKEVLLAAGKHRSRQKYSPPTQNTPPTIKFIGACLDGTALMSMVVCLSQAPQNGWETWFSLKYGTDLSKLASPVKDQQGQDIKKVHAAAVAEAKKTAAAVPAAEPHLKDPKFKFYKRYVANAAYAGQQVEQLELLLEVAGRS